MISLAGMWPALKHLCVNPIKAGVPVFGGVKIILGTRIKIGITSAKVYLNFAMSKNTLLLC